MSWSQPVTALAITKVPDVGHNRAVLVVGAAGIEAYRLIDHGIDNVGAGIAER